MTDILTLSLSELGFSSVEIGVYQAFLKDRNLNLSRYAELQNLDRSFIYKALISLEKAGLIYKESRGSYKIEPPSKIAAMLKLKERTTRSILENLNDKLPEISNQFQKTYRSIGTKVYEGNDQFVNLMNQVLSQSPAEILYYGNSQNLINFVDIDFQKEWSLTRAKKGIKSKMLTFPAKSLSWFVERNLEQKRNLKYLPTKFYTDGFIWVYGNISIQWNPILPKAVLTEDKIIADNFRSMFETLWDLV